MSERGTSESKRAERPSSARESKPSHPSHDPWLIEAARPKRLATRPELGPVRPVAVLTLGLLAAVRALGLVLVAGAIAAGIAALQRGDLDPRAVLILGASGAILRSVATWATDVVARRIAIAVKSMLRRDLWAWIARGGASGEGGIAVLATDGLDELDDYYVRSLPAMIAAVAVPVIVGLRILGADWFSAIVVVLTVPLIPFFMVLIGRHTQARTDEALGALSRLADHLTELARGLPVLVGLGRVADQSRALDGIQRAYRERTQQTLRTAFLSALALELIATISVALVAVFLGLRLMQGSVGLEPAILVLVLAPECFTVLRDVGAAFHSSQNGLSALQRVREMLAAGTRSPVAQRSEERAQSHSPVAPRSEERAESKRAEQASSASAPKRVRTAPDLHLDGLSVAYPGRPALPPTTALLTGIAAITGPSGAGKSTLLSALAGTLPADATVTGSITGTDPDRIAYAPQAPRGFAATPREELDLYGAAAGALAEVGLAHVADARIAELSPGELRRLAVARALARMDAGATLLLLDEPTAHLDPNSAALVRAAILARAPHCVVVLATHEPETLALATSHIEIGTANTRDLPTTQSRRISPMPRSGETPDPPHAAVAPVARADRDPAEEPQASGLAGLALRAGTAAPQRDPAPRDHPTDQHPHSDPHPQPSQPSHPRATAHWIAGTLLAFLAVALGLALSAVSGWLIVRASVEEYIMYLLVAIVGVRFFGIGRSVARYAERLFTHEAAFRMVDALRLRLWRSIASRGAGSRRLLEGGSPVDYLVILADELRDLLPRIVPPLAVGVLSVVGAVVTTALVVPSLALPVGAALVVASAVGGWAAVAGARGAQRTRIRERSEMVRGTAALSTAAEDLRGNGVADRALTMLARIDARLARAERRGVWGASLGGAVMVLATALLAVSVAALAPTTAAELVCVVALLSLALLEPLSAAVDAAHRVPALLEVRTRLRAVLADTPRATPARSLVSSTEGAASRPREPGDMRPRTAPIRVLVLDGVAAAYGDTPVFSGVSGEARAGEWLVVAGPSGSGKSTLLSIVMGALPAAGGSVRVDGVPLAELDAEAWRSHVAWCPQDAYVFDSTLRGNLLLARPGASESEMAEVLERVGLGPLLRGLPDGLDTRVGPAGSALSGGERQRLAVARALLTHADVILLDEPTAHLDAPTAAAMMRDLRAATADRIVLLVSHRPADRRPSDRVVTLSS